MTRRVRPAIHIELKHADRLRDAELMRAALERAGLVGQPVDARRAVALTGMPLDQAAEALSALSLTRRAQLDSDDAGELVYRFASLARVQAPRVVDRVGELVAQLEPLLDVLVTLGVVAVGLVICAGGAYLSAYVASIEAIPVLLRFVAVLVSGALFLATALLFAFPAVPLYLFAQIPAHMAAEDGTPGAMLFGGLFMGFGAVVYGWVIGGQVRRNLRDFLTRLYMMGQPASDALADERRFLAMARAHGRSGAAVWLDGG